MIKRKKERMRMNYWKIKSVLKERKNGEKERKKERKKERMYVWVIEKKERKKECMSN